MHNVPSPANALFPTTMWTIVVDAGDGDEGAALQALEHLARAYWQPLYVFLRQRGHGHEQAADSVQGFFEHLLAREVLRGVEQRETRFRTFLLTCFTHWLSNQRRDGATARRGGKATIVPLEEMDSMLIEAEPIAEENRPEHGFDRRWARALFDHALERLDAEIAGKARREFLQVLRQRLFGPTAASSDWEPVAAQFEMNVGAVRKAAHDLRQRFAELLRHEVRKVVSRDADVDDELRYLVRLLTTNE